MYKGFVITELLIVLAIVAVLALVAAPAYRNLVVHNRVNAAAESLYIDMALARSEAIRKQSTVTVVMQTGASWCYGLTDNASCNCTTVNSCLLNGTERVVHAASFPGVSIAVSGLLNNAVSFEGIHGTTGATGQVNFNVGSKILSVAVRPMGQVKVCASDFSGYSAC